MKSRPAPTRAIDPRTLRHMPLKGDLRELIEAPKPEPKKEVE